MFHSAFPFGPGSKDQAARSQPKIRYVSSKAQNDLYEFAHARFPFAAYRAMLSCLVYLQFFVGQPFILSRHRRASLHKDFALRQTFHPLNHAVGSANSMRQLQTKNH
jgi:hypothetical protein